MFRTTSAIRPGPSSAGPASSVSGPTGFTLDAQLKAALEQVGVQAEFNEAFQDAEKQELLKALETLVPPEERGFTTLGVAARSVAVGGNKEALAALCTLLDHGVVQ